MAVPPGAGTGVDLAVSREGVAKNATVVLRTEPMISSSSRRGKLLSETPIGVRNFIMLSISLPQFADHYVSFQKKVLTPNIRLGMMYSMCLLIRNWRNS